MNKPSIPEDLPISPITIVCPLCHAKPGKDCSTSSGTGLGVVHVARVKAAAKLDAAVKKSKWEIVVRKRKPKKRSKVVSLEMTVRKLNAIEGGKTRLPLK